MLFKTKHLNQIFRPSTFFPLLTQRHNSSFRCFYGLGFPQESVFLWLVYLRVSISCCVSERDKQSEFQTFSFNTPSMSELLFGSIPAVYGFRRQKNRSHKAVKMSILPRADEKCSAFVNIRHRKVKKSQALWEE